MNLVWLLGHRTYPDHYTECRVCRRETTAHTLWCPLTWIYGLKGHDMLDFIKAHRKTIVAAVAAVVVIFADDQTAQEVAAVVGTILGFLVPNDQDAIDRIYRR